jgi:prepilin-type N-terminal cleavage/methylation domain-containing protein
MRAKDHRAFTLVELLVVIAIIGVLVALLLPAIQAAREAARRSQCVNNLKQIGLALQTYNDTHGRYPLGRNSTDQKGVSWSFELLPHMEQASIYNAYDPNQEVFQPSNATAMRSPVSTFYCPSRRQPAADRNFDNDDEEAPEEYRGVAAGGDYAGCAGLKQGYGRNDKEGRPPEDEGGVLYSYSRIKNRYVTDGLSNSLAVGERYIPTSFETEPKDSLLEFEQGDTAFFAADNVMVAFRGTECGLAEGGTDPTNDHCDTVPPDHVANEKFGSEHPGITQFVFLDGHVSAINNDVDLVTLQRLSTVADGQEVSTENL